MRILALDTATQSCSTAVMDGDTLLAEAILDTHMSHSAHILGAIQSVLQWADLALEDIEGFAVTRGPGSFTGLRIALSTIKGLALAKKRPLVGVSGLEALAWQVDSGDRLICPFIDARKGEVYCAGYRRENGELVEVHQADVLAPQEALARIDAPSVFIGSGAVLYKNIIAKKIGELAVFLEPVQNIIRASTIASLSRSRFEAGHTDDVETIVPLYIRKSDAEINIGQINH